MSARKRSAEETPLPREEASIKVIEERFEESRKRIQETTSQTQAPSSSDRSFSQSGAPPLLDGPLSQHSAKITEAIEEDTTPFDYAQIPLKPLQNRCALAVHDSSSLRFIGSVNGSSIDWAAQIRIDAGLLGFPSIKLVIDVANPLTGRSLVKEPPLKKERWSMKHTGNKQRSDKQKAKQPGRPSPSVQKLHYHTVCYCWYAATPGHDGNLMIQAVEYQAFSSWLASTDPHTQNLPAVQAISATADVQYTVVVTCHLGSPILSPLNATTTTTTWKRLPPDVSKQFDALMKEVKVSFFFRKKGPSEHLALLRQRMLVKSSILSQYYSTTTGEYTLNQIEDASPVEKVGGGIYLNADGTLRQLPTFDEFLSLAHFRIYTALGPIREAQGVNPTHPHLWFQRQLNAVNDFCDFEQTAIVNFRHLLMTGGKSNPWQRSISSIYGPSTHLPASFLPVLEHLKELRDSSQFEFFEKLSDIKDNTVALTGPAGSGKTYLLCLTIWVSFFLGHKVLVCAVDDKAVDSLMLRVANAQPSWVPSKNLLRLTENDDSPTATILAPALDVLFTTLHHAGSDQLKLLDFNPAIVAVYPADKASIPSLCIPVTRFCSWEFLILMGDRHQSRPLISRGTKSEVAEHSKRSALEVLHGFQTNTVTLEGQHRMCRTIASFPASQFYGGQFQFCHNTLMENETRRKVRRTSSKYYQIKGKHGSEYFSVDVPDSQSRSEEEGSTLANYGNATAVEELVANLNNEGIPADEIVVLCFYRLQVDLLSDKVQASPDGTRGCREVRTVDSFHDQEAKVVIVDFVAANPMATFVPGLGSEYFEDPRQKGLSDFVNDPRRINLALTRAKDGLIAVGQLALFVAQVFKGGALGNSLFWMVSDAMKRRLVHCAQHIVDNHPSAIYGREVSGIMTDATTEDATVAMKNYRAFLEEKLFRGRCNKTIGG